MSIEDSFNFRRVTDLITTSGMVRSRHFERLAEDGYGLVINLLPDDSEYALASESSIVESQGAKYVYIPIDFAAPHHSEFEHFCSVLDSYGNVKTHIHCAANYRASAFVGLYLLSRGIWTTENADQLMASLWNPREHPIWEAFINDERIHISEGD